ncbi:MAG: NAD(P)H-binding protein [Steroidobacteraceae bacterium]|jgi:uncharacterized protein YbjT (DUF2867 family)
MNPQFRVIVIGGTGQVGSAVVQALLSEPVFREVVLVTRRPVPSADPSRLRSVAMDTGAPDFELRVGDLAGEIAAAGDRVSAVSCVGVGSGSLRWTEAQLEQLEVGVVGAFARGVRQAGVVQFCLLSAAGANAGSRIKYTRIMGLKEAAIQAVQFPRLAIFRPGIIVGNAHTPRWVGWLGKLVPGPWGNIEQRDIGRAFVAEIAAKAAESGVTVYDNRAMRKIIADFAQPKS